MSRALRLLLTMLVAITFTGAAFAAPAFAAAPTITSFAPASGGSGTAVVINGTNFTSTATVVFGTSAPVAITFTSTTRITAKVPADATTGHVKVITTGGTATSAASFTVTPWVGATPPVAPPGGTVPVTGGGFGPFEAVDVYLGTNDVALVTTGAGGTFAATITVPSYQAPGTLWITAVGRHSGSAAQKAIVVRSNWLQFQGGPNHPGFDTRENVLDSSSVSNLDTAWTFTAGGALGGTPRDRQRNRVLRRPVRPRLRRQRGDGCPGLDAQPGRRGLRLPRAVGRDGLHR